MRIEAITPTQKHTIEKCLVIAVCGKDVPCSLKISASENLLFLLNAIVLSEELSADAGSSFVTHLLIDNELVRVIIIQLGENPRLPEIRKASACAIKLAFSEGGGEVGLHWIDDLANGLSPRTLAEVIAQTAITEAYDSGHLKKLKLKQNRPQLMHLYARQALIPDIQCGIADGVSIGAGINFTKMLGDLPPNICTPSYLGNQAKLLQVDHKVQVSVACESEIRELGMDAFLSVARGSVEPPKLIIVEYSGGTGKPIVLVGKGITFDSGGISIKTGDGVDEMKYDMQGAGTVLGVLKIAIDLKVPLNLIGIIPTCENMPSGNSLRPGDIVGSLAGTSIEVLNTDAEGRLILCDALAFAERYEPDCVIDIATLTGACVVALGNVASGMYANDEVLANELLLASEASGEKTWRMPLWDEYQKELESNFADIANVGGKYGGSAIAACFLSYFTKNYKWAHFDMAGIARRSGLNKGATGRPVTLLVEFIRHRAMYLNG